MKCLNCEASLEGTRQGTSSKFRDVKYVLCSDCGNVMMIKGGKLHNSPVDDSRLTNILMADAATALKLPVQGMAVSKKDAKKAEPKMDIDVEKMADALSSFLSGAKVRQVNLEDMFKTMYGGVEEEDEEVEENRKCCQCDTCCQEEEIQLDPISSILLKGLEDMVKARTGKDINMLEDPGFITAISNSMKAGSREEVNEIINDYAEESFERFFGKKAKTSEDRRDFMVLLKHQGEVIRFEDVTKEQLEKFINKELKGREFEVFETRKIEVVESIR